MEVTLDQVLNGKATKIKNRDYLPTKAYVEPFLERMSKFTDDFKVQVQLPDQITRTVTGELNVDDITYNRVWIQATLPDELNFPNHREAISLLYALDTRKPVVKIFRAGINMACLNLCVFNPSFINLQPLEPESPINFKCIQPLMEETSDICVWLKHLEETEVPYDRTIMDKNLGNWIHNSITKSWDNGFGKVKLGAPDVLDAFKDVYINEASPYYVKEGESTSMFNIYNSFTDIISHSSKDIVNPIDKTLLLKEILSL